VHPKRLFSACGNRELPKNSAAMAGIGKREAGIERPSPIWRATGAAARPGSVRFRSGGADVICSA
jgi:hypothetical protein